MKVGAIDRAAAARSIAPIFMSVNMVVIEIWLIKVVTPSQKWCTYWERDCWVKLPKSVPQHFSRAIPARFVGSMVNPYCYT